MTQDEMARAITDLTKRVQQIETNELRKREPVDVRPVRAPGLEADREHPGRALGIGTHASFASGGLVTAPKGGDEMPARLSSGMSLSRTDMDERFERMRAAIDRDQV